LTAVNSQGSASRGNTEVDERFLEIYNKEFVAKRPLQHLDIASKDDLVLNDLPAFNISLLKKFFETHEVNLNEDEE
jgi:hypothetical protein